MTGIVFLSNCSIKSFRFNGTNYWEWSEKRAWSPCGQCWAVTAPQFLYHHSSNMDGRQGSGTSLVLMAPIIGNDLPLAPWGLLDSGPAIKGWRERDREVEIIPGIIPAVRALWTWGKHLEQEVITGERDQKDPEVFPSKVSCRIPPRDLQDNILALKMPQDWTCDIFSTSSHGWNYSACNHSAPVPTLYYFQFNFFFHT